MQCKTFTDTCFDLYNLDILLKNTITMLYLENFILFLILSLIACQCQQGVKCGSGELGQNKFIIFDVAEGFHGLNCFYYSKDD